MNSKKSFSSGVNFTQPVVGAKEWKQKSMMTATSLETLNQAFKKFENNTGPGQYEQQDLHGTKITSSPMKNNPSFSIGFLRPVFLNPETRNTI